MPNLPGTGLARRPLHFIWLCDCSGSMSVNGKIQALNNAIKEGLPQMKIVADENPNADVLVRALKFSNGSIWHMGVPTAVQDFRWLDLEADPLAQASVDIIFLMDTSGSMGDEIEAVKDSCYSFAENIIQQGANVRLGLIGFDIGGHAGSSSESYIVKDLSRYTIGTWNLTAPRNFQNNIRELSLCLFGGGGCYIANKDTVDIFPHIVMAFDGPPENIRILIIVSDEMGKTDGVSEIVEQLNENSITTHVLGVSKTGGAHQAIASMTGGQFWDINKTKGKHDFSSLLHTVSDTIAKEVTKHMADGSVSTGTDMGKALSLVAEQMKMPPMDERGLPPVLVLISDGQPTDDFNAGLAALLAQRWGQKSVRIAIAIGGDADLEVLQKFIGHNEIKPLQANNADALTNYIKWASTAVLKSASQPATQIVGEVKTGLNIPIPTAPEESSSITGDVW
jgi:uncharacterized protein YegL